MITGTVAGSAETGDGAIKRHKKSAERTAPITSDYRVWVPISIATSKID